MMNINDNVNILSNTHSMIEDLNESNSSLYKKEKLKKYMSSSSGDDNKRKLLYYVHNPFYKFGLTSKTMKSKRGTRFKRDARPKDYDNIFDLLDDLRNRNITGHRAILSAQKYMDKVAQDDTKLQEAFYRILDKNLKVRIGKRMLNTIEPNFIPEFNVCLGQPFHKFTNYMYDSISGRLREDWTLSRKYDGERCIMFLLMGVDGQPPRIESYSRKGHLNLTATRVVEQELLEKLIPKLALADGDQLTNWALDGEVCIVDPASGLELFSQTQKAFRKKGTIIENPRYYIFDAVPLEHFLQSEWNVTFDERIDMIGGNWLGQDGGGQFEHVRLAEHEPCPDKVEDIMKRLAIVDGLGWEGLMARRSKSLYNAKRTKDLLKLKIMDDGEFLVVDINYNDISMIVDGVNKQVNCLQSVNVEHLGKIVQVGSGFSQAERVEYGNDPEKILNHWITVQYFRVSENKKGEFSLRFPVFKTIRHP